MIHLHLARVAAVAALVATTAQNNICGSLLASAPPTNAPPVAMAVGMARDKSGPFGGNVCLAWNNGQTQAARTVYVKKTAPAGGTGSSWSTAFRTLDEALGAAVAGDSIWVARGTYAPPASGIDVMGIAIRGGFAGTEASASARNIRLNETIITPGDADDHDRAQLTLQGGSTLDGIVISGIDAAGDGCALYFDGSAQVIDCVIRDNRLDDFAPVVIREYAPIISFDRCTFENNYSRDGRSGGIYVGTWAYLTVTNCAFIGNSSSYSGAIESYATSTRIYNCLFTDNYGELNAGAICSGSGDDYTLIANCTISGNYGEEGPGGVLLGYALFADVYNTIIWGNEGGLVGEEQEFICEEPSATHFERCIIEDWSGTAYSYYAVTDDDPLFEDAGVLDFRLRTASPAIDAGDTRLTPSWLLVDVARNRRRVDAAGANTGVAASAGGPIVDIGAYEKPQ